VLNFLLLPKVFVFYLFICSFSSDAWSKSQEYRNAKTQHIATRRGNRAIALHYNFKDIVKAPIKFLVVRYNNN